MQQPIDIDEEKAKLWARVYVCLRERLNLLQVPFKHANLPYPVTAVSIDDGSIVVSDRFGTMKLVEEYDDEVLYEIFQCVLSMVSETPPKGRREVAG